MDSIKPQFLKNPDKDVSRTHKFNFSIMVFYLIAMEASALKNELFKFSNYNTATPTSSAFVQQKSKIDYQAFEYLFHSFISVFKPCHFYKGYHLLAIDGSVLPIVYNPNDESTFISYGNAKGYNSVHINALYDLLSQVYTDIIIQHGTHYSENSTYNDFIDRYNCDKNHYLWLIADLNPSIILNMPFVKDSISLHELKIFILRQVFLKVLFYLMMSSLWMSN